MSSKSMLCDRNLINDINPFWANPPGTWSDPYPYATPGPLEEPKPHKDEPSPICGWGVTAGDNTVSVCKPPYNFPPKKSCPMSRPLVPMQLFENGLWSLDKEHPKHKDGWDHVPMCFVVLLLVVMLVLMHTAKR